MAIAQKYLDEVSQGIDGAFRDRVAQLVKAKGLPPALIENSEFIDITDKFEKTYNLDFNPTSSVIGAIVSQEIVKAITKRDFPCHGLAVYDSIS